MINQEKIDEILSKINIVELISEYVKLKKKGTSYFGLCPFHNEKTPSFSVSESKQIFYCFGCHKGGNAIKFLEEYEHYSFFESLKYLGEKVGITVEPNNSFKENNKKEKDIIQNINKEVAIEFHNQLKEKEGLQGYKYLIDRKLNDNTIIHFGLGFSPKDNKYIYKFLKKKGYDDNIIKLSGLVIYNGNDYNDRFRNRIIFPIMNTNNNVIGFGGRVMGNDEPKYLNSSDTLLFNKSKNLFGLNFAKRTKEKYLILCEGYMDVIQMHQAGFTNAIASLGTALTESQCKLIARYTDEIILSYDSDDAGINATLRAIPLLREVNINPKILSLNPYKDPDDFLKNESIDSLKERIKNSKNFFIFEIEQIKKNYNLSDPTEKTNFEKKIVEKLFDFKEKLERNNYLKAICHEYNINEEYLLEMVSNYMLKQNNYFKEKYSNQKTINIDKILDIKIQDQFFYILFNKSKFINLVQKYLNIDDIYGDFYKNILTELYNGKSFNDIQIKYENNNSYLDKLHKYIIDNNYIIGLNLNEDIDVKKILESLIKKIKIQNYQLLSKECDVSSINIYKKLINIYKDEKIIL
ncbi:MAG: DNA primase [Eubacteriales bacterium]|nr:DNA primase [Eubacteriales bacterium]